MNVFGNGMIAAAAGGAAAGLGGGIQQAAQMGFRQQMMERMNELAQKREESITRLRAGYEQQLQERRIQGERGLAEQRQGFESKRLGVEIGARSRAARATREFEHGETTRKLRSEEARAQTRAGAVVEAARLRAEATKSRAGGAAGPKWSNKALTYQDAKGNSRQVMGLVSSSGRAYIPAGDKYLPYDAQQPNGFNAKITARAPTPAVAELMRDPFGIIPQGSQDAGLTKVESFERHFGFLPSAVVPRLQQGGAPGTTTSASSVERGGTAPTIEQTPETPYKEPGGEDVQGEAEARELENESESEAQHDFDQSSRGMESYDNAAPS